MKTYTFKVDVGTIEGDIEADSEEEAREELLRSLDELGFSHYITPKDFELVGVSDAGEAR